MRGAGLGSHSSWGLVGQVQLVFCSCVVIKICVGLIILTAPHRGESSWDCENSYALHFKFKEVSHPGKEIQMCLPGKRFIMSHGHCNHPALGVSWLPDKWSSEEAWLRKKPVVPVVPSLSIAGNGLGETPCARVKLGAFLSFIFLFCCFF